MKNIYEWHSGPEDSREFKNFNEKLDKRSFGKDVCFLCGISLQKVESTSEHVIPKWVQNRYDLWNQKLILLNRTGIPYRQLTIPCCGECNKYRLQPIEISISSAISSGPEAVRNLGDKVLFLWLGKIFYGILYKELFLRLERRSVETITIVNPKLLRQYKSHLFFLQQARDRIELIGFCAGSILVFRTQKPENIMLQWDFTDNINTMFIAVRMGEVGIIGVLGDGGAQKSYEESYKDIINLPLHPIQFRELCAHFSYRATLFTRTPKYMALQGKPHKVFQMPLAGLSNKPIFEKWDFSEYAKFLSHYTEVPIEYCFEPPTKVLSFLHDDSGRPNYMDFTKYPFLSGAE